MVILFQSTGILRPVVHRIQANNSAWISTSLHKVALFWLLCTLASAFATLTPHSKRYSTAIQLSKRSFFKLPSSLQLWCACTLSELGSTFGLFLRPQIGVNFWQSYCRTSFIWFGTCQSYFHRFWCTILTTDPSSTLLSLSRMILSVTTLLWRTAT